MLLLQGLQYRFFHPDSAGSLSFPALRSPAPPSGPMPLRLQVLVSVLLSFFRPPVFISIPKDTHRVQEIKPPRRAFLHAGAVRVILNNVRGTVWYALPGGGR